MRPLKHLAAIGGLFPNAWKQVEIFRQSKGRDLPDWPNWCFLPYAAWHEMATFSSLADAVHTGALAALGTWRYSQGIYRFHREAFDAIAETTPSGEMPCDVLYRLPEWCIYLETPGSTWLGEPLHGFFASLEYDVNTHGSELRLLLDCDNGLIPVPIHMGRWTVTEGVDRAIQEAEKHGLHRQGVDIVTPMASQLYSLVSLLLYACSDEPEICDDAVPGASPERPKPKKTKRGWKLFPAKKPRVWTVGRQLGESLVRDHQGGAHSVTPHLRRAHWHGYWSGPKDSDRHFQYKWLPPIFVGKEKSENERAAPED